MDVPDETLVFSIASPVPVMTRKRFGLLTGLDDGVLRGMVNRDYLPTIKVGRYRLINLVALTQQCRDENAKS